MITYSKLRKLNVEIADARAAEDTLDARIEADDVVEYSDITEVPDAIQRYFYQATAPVPGVVACVNTTIDTNDVWIDSDTFVRYVWDGDEWIISQEDLDQIPDGSTYERVLGTYITSGKVVVAGDTGNFVVLDGPNGKIYINDSTFGNDGIQLDYNSGNPRFYCGDGANEYFKFDGTNVEISVSKANALTIKSGGDILLEDGGDLILDSSDTSPAKIIFQDSGEGVNHIIFERDAANDAVYVYPETSTAGGFRVGMEPDGAGGTNYSYFGDIQLWASEDIYVRVSRTTGYEAQLWIRGNANSSDLRLTAEGASGTIYLDLNGQTQNVEVIATALTPYTDSVTTCGTSGLCWSNVYADAGVTGCSDRKYKTDIEQEALGLDFINALVPISYNWKKDGKRPKNKHGTYHGFIAPEVESVVEQFGYDRDFFAGVERSTDDDGELWYGLMYNQLIAPIVKSIQQLTEKVTALEIK